MLRYQLFPRSVGMTETISQVIACFEKHIGEFESPAHNLKSDEVLRILAPDLKGLGFLVEESKSSEDKIKVPVLFSLNNRIDKFFDADAVSSDGRIVLEVEAGRAYSNNQFLKDVFQACMMYGVDYLMIETITGGMPISIQYSTFSRHSTSTVASSFRSKVLY